MIVVTGGAGYIGSHATRYLIDKGHQVLVLDNLSTGNLKAIDKRATFIKGDIGDIELVNNVFQNYDVDGIIHFAANCIVEESTSNPLMYYQNNIGNTLNLLEAMVKNNIKNIIFSSTCATYGIPPYYPISEHTPQSPINPYGKSKFMVEQILKDLAETQKLNYVIFRYFNVAGADTSGEIGEYHDPETHLIPNILKHIQGKTDAIYVYGNDYETLDGTCIRDYIHVTDICSAHILGLEYLLNSRDKKVTEVFNIGNDKGYSVLEIIHQCEEVTQKKANVKFLPKRKGDPPILVSSSSKLKKVLGWSPQFDLKQIVQTAWNWHKEKPNGF